MSSIVISSQSQLTAALSQATGGETFLLAAGSYSVNLSGKTFTSPVTVTSADSSRPARIGFTSLTDVSNMTFKSIDLGRSLSSSESVNAAVMVRVQGGSNITYENVHVHGSMDGNARNDGSGFLVNKVNGFKLINSELEQLGRGGNFNGSQNVTIAGNNVHDIRSDGFDFAQVKNVLVDNNRFTNFQPISTDHPDAIQFWTANTTSPSTDIVIRNNVVLQGHGSGVQGIFLRDDKGGLPYDRVTIQNNFISGSNMANGIAVLGGKSVNVTSNTVISPTTDATKVWIRLEKVSGGSITKNIADLIWNAGTNVTESGNLLTSAAGFSSSLLNNIASISVSDFLVDGYGYQVPISSGSILSPTPTPTPSPTPTPTPTSSVTPTPTPTSTSTSTTGKIVKSQSELDTALANAKGGETLLVAAGNYTLSLYNKAYASTVTVASLDASNPAKFSYTKLSNVSNLTLQSLDLGRATDTYNHMVRIMGGSNIKFDSVFVHGSLDGNKYDDGLGFVVDSGAKNISLVNSRFEQLNYVGQFSGVNGLTLAGNTLKDIRSSTAYVLNSVTNLVQSAAVTSQSIQKIALNSTTYAAETSFTPSSLSDTLALSEPSLTQSSQPLSTAASVFTPMGGQTVQRWSRLAANRVTTAAEATVSSSQWRQRFYQFAAAQ